MKEEGLQIYLTHYIEELVKNEAEIVMALLNVFLEKCKPEAQNEKEELVNMKIKEYKEEEEEEEPESENQLDFLDAVRRLYEYVAALIEEKHDFIEKYFGKKGLEIVVQTLLARIDTHISKIYETFISIYKLTDIVSKFFIY